MADLRAPDPTLTAYWQQESYGVDVAVRDPYLDASVAHRIVGQTKVACGSSWEWWFTHPAFAARWFCRPCRTCFRDAPPPGHVVCDHGGCDDVPDCPGWMPYGRLAWQVTRC